MTQSWMKLASCPRDRGRAVAAPSNRYTVAVDAVISPRLMMSRSARRDLANSAVCCRVSDFGATGPSCPAATWKVGHEVRPALCGLT